MKSDRQTILLTGATGFFGSHLLEKLLSDGNFDVLVAARSSSNFSRLNHIDKTKFEMFLMDQCNFEDVLKTHNINHIVHVATEYGRGNVSAASVLESNLIMPIMLLEAAVKCGVESFVNTDSYFNKKNFSYSHLPNYSLSKKCLGTWLEHFANDIKVVNVMLEHIYGPNDRPEKFVEQMVKKIAIDKSVKVDLTYGHQERDFIYVDDAASAYLQILSEAMKQSFRFRNYSLGTGRVVSIRTFVEMIKKVSMSPTELNFGGVAYRHDEIMHSKGDPLELYNLGWKPTWTIEAGIAKIVETYLSEA